MTQPKFKPILFSAPMVRALLDGRKTQTRRLLKHDSDGPMNEPSTTASVTYSKGEPAIAHFRGVKSKEFFAGYKCPYGKPGDVLWVRETWGINYFGRLRPWHFKEGIEIKMEDLVYKSTAGMGYAYGDNDAYFLLDKKWRPSIHMPKAACRLFLAVVDVRVERLQDISEEDAHLEGCDRTMGHKLNMACGESAEEVPHKQIFRKLWQSINGLDSWDANPWLWVVTFKRIEKPENWPR